MFCESAQWVLALSTFLLLAQENDTACPWPTPFWRAAQILPNSRFWSKKSRSWVCCCWPMQLPKGTNKSFKCSKSTAMISCSKEDQKGQLMIDSRFSAQKQSQPIQLADYFYHLTQQVWRGAGFFGHFIPIIAAKECRKISWALTHPWHQDITSVLWSYSSCVCQLKPSLACSDLSS